MLLLSFCTISSLLSSSSAAKVISTTNGLIQGRLLKTEARNFTYAAYLGIPFAEPPVGNLRFEPPVPKKKWNGILNATKQGNICVQNFPAQGSEDCLYLNVFVPSVTQRKTHLLPVMLWIYGGGFSTGSANQSLYSPDYLIDKGVLVVTFNYRLGIFGFISTGDLIAPGNVGLKDQLLVMKWVKNNIKQFGGDPGQITIFGESAGAASVSYHLQSSKSRGLFQRAIIESGNTLCAWALSRNIPEIVKRIGRDFLITGSSRELIDRLKKVDYTTLQSYYEFNVLLEYLVFHDPRSGLAFGPVIEPEHDGAFFTNKSHFAMTKGDFAKVPCIIGFNSLEANVNLGIFSGLFDLFVFINYDLNNTNLIPIDLNVDPDEVNSASSKIKRFYFGKKSIAQSGYQRTKFISDDQFVRPTVEYVRLIFRHLPVYFYRFSYEGGLSDVQDRTYPGVAHAEELSYIWKSERPASNEDRLTRDRLTTLWTNFAKTGNPTPSSNSEIIWERSDENITYLDIGKKLSIKQFPEAKAIRFWDEICNKYGNPPFDTY